MSSIWNKSIRLSVFGESHGPVIGGVLEGLPEGIKIDEAFLSDWMKRRISSESYETGRKETDIFEITSGVYDGFTTGTPISVIIPNKQASKSEEAYRIARPSHSDYAAFVKHKGFNDIRGGGHYSARLTAVMTFFGGISAFILKKSGVFIASHILSLGEEVDRPFNMMGEATKALEALSLKNIPTLLAEKEARFKEIIENYRERNDTLGGEIECIAMGLPVGLGSPIFDGLDSSIASLLFSIPSVKAVEFGVKNAWRGVASEVNDQFAKMVMANDKTSVLTATNYNGGLCGGITNGMPLIFRVGMKPIPSIRIEQNGFDLLSGRITTFKSHTPSDSNQLPRACVIIESAAALALLDAMLNSNLI